MLILNADDIRRALPMKTAIAGMKSAFAAFSSGKSQVPQRTQLPVTAHEGISIVMPALLADGENDALTVKIVSVFPHNPERNLPTIHAAVLVLESNSGRPLALLEGGSLTAIRTGAASGAATDLLARSNSKNVTIFGAGVQGRTQLDAICAVRPIENIWIYDIDPQRARAFIEQAAKTGHHFRTFKLAASPEEAVASADIICTATTSNRPVFQDNGIKIGAHINAVGAYTPEMAEIPIATLARAQVYVDSTEAVIIESGEILNAINQKMLFPIDLTELGDLVLGKASGRKSLQEITVFKSVGIAVQDAIAARLALKNAIELGLGQNVVF